MARKALSSTRPQPKTRAKRKKVVEAVEGELIEVQAGLTLRAQHFVLEYLVDLNATQAAIRAGYSKESAGAIGHELLKKPEIALAVEQAMAARAARLGITVDMVLAEFAKVGFSDLSRVASWGGDTLTLKDSADLTDIDRAAIAEISSTTTEHGGTVRIKLHDKVGALTKIAQHMAMFPTKAGEIKGSIEGKSEGWRFSFQINT